MSNSSPSIALFLAQSTAGFLSFTASSIILYKILQSRTKLNSPYSRLIFGLSANDAICSLVHLFASLPVPKDTPNVWGAVGNDTTCAIQGFLYMMSGVSTPFYNLSLCIYFLCVIKYSMSDEKFSKWIEPPLHAIPLLHGLASAIYATSTGYISPAVDRPVCFIGSSNNSKEDEKFAKLLFMILVMLPMAIIFLGIAILMGIIFWKVWSQNRWMDRYRFQAPASSGNTSSKNGATSSSPTASTTSGTTSPRYQRFQVNSTRINRRVQAAKSKATLYFSCILLIYGPFFLWGGGVLKHALPFICIVWFLFPLQGVFNILIHLHPHVQTIGRSNPEHCYLRRFYTALVTYDSLTDQRATSTTRPRRNSRIVVRTSQP